MTTETIFSPFLSVSPAHHLPPTPFCQGFLVLDIFLNQVDVPQPEGNSDSRWDANTQGDKTANRSLTQSLPLLMFQRDPPVEPAKCELCQILSEQHVQTRTA